MWMGEGIAVTQCIHSPKRLGSTKRDTPIAHGRTNFQAKIYAISKMTMVSLFEVWVCRFLRHREKQCSVVFIAFRKTVWVRHNDQQRNQPVTVEYTIPYARKTTIVFSIRAIFWLIPFCSIFFLLLCLCDRWHQTKWIQLPVCLSFVCSDPSLGLFGSLSNCSKNCRLEFGEEQVMSVDPQSKGFLWTIVIFIFFHATMFNDPGLPLSQGVPLLLAPSLQTPLNRSFPLTAII